MSRWTVHHAEVLDALAAMDSCSHDAALLDPPYGLGSKQPTAVEIIAYLNGADLDTGGDFMGADWSVPSVRVWRELLRVLKPGAYAFVYGGSRTYDLISVGLRAAGFEVRDTFHYLYGSAMPHSLACDKALDALALDRWLESRPVEAAWFRGAESWIDDNDDDESVHAKTMRDAIVDAAGLTRAVIGEQTLTGNAAVPTKDKGGTYGVAVGTVPPKTVPITAPASELGKIWDGQGTAAKPCYEPVILARKPLDGTVAQNIERWGTAGLAIDECRIGYASDDDKAAAAAAAAQRACHPADRSRLEYGFKNTGESLDGFFAKQDAGRWPGNIILVHDDGCELVGHRKIKGHSGYPNGPGGSSSQLSQKGTKTTRKDPWPGHADANGEETLEEWRCVPSCPVRMLDEQSGNRPGMSGGGKHSAGYAGGMFGAIDSTHTARNDNGGCSRFFFSAKASRSERELGCEHLPKRTAAATVGRDADSPGIKSGRAGAGRTSGARNFHPNCKPIGVGKWLATLIKPPANRPHGPTRLLNIYSGSGSEMVAAILAGWDEVVGVEREPRRADSPDYLSILKARCAFAEANPRAFEPGAVKRDAHVIEGQVSLFGAAE